MVTQPQYITLNEMPFLIKPLEKEHFKNLDVIYVVLTVEESGETTVIDVGQTQETGAPPMDNPRRRACWEEHAKGRQILVGEHRSATDFNMAEDRLQMIAQLRYHYRPPCGPVNVSV